MAIDIFQKIDAHFEAPIQAFITTGVTGVTAYLTTPMRVAASLYITIYGIMMFRGLAQASVMDFLFQCLKIVIIITLATKAAEYHRYVTDLFYQTLPQGIGNALAKGKTLSPNAFDNLAHTGFQAGLNIWKKASYTDLGAMIICGLVFLFSALGSVIAYAISLYTKVALSVVLAVGPIFISLALFQPTRKFTEGWIGQVANYVVLQVLVVAVLLLTVSVSDQLATQITSGDIFITGLSYIIIYALAGFIALQLPSIASALAAGGASLSIGVAAVGAAAAGIAAGKIASRAAGAAGRAGLNASNRMMTTAMHGRQPNTPS
ncbi:type IV secretion system protein [Microvirga alba]|uniref:Type IV secretion system protein n=1 Tax=Microvirga alba TaxID=2791025 RepID=A0A931FQ91_9HYPH|nr:type IV secretion system protein [Microvirga alba]MBF9235610.1 type IV secretion system protein [Microvirga alba]